MQEAGDDLNQIERLLDRSFNRVLVCTKHKRPAWLHPSYLLDWTMLVPLALTLLFLSWVEPYHRYMLKDDISITYPLVAEEVPTWAMGFILPLPVVVFTVVRLVTHNGHDYHHALLGFCQALVLNGLITQALKLGCGRYRPDYWAMKNVGQELDARQSFPYALVMKI